MKKESEEIKEKTLENMSLEDITEIVNKVAQFQQALKSQLTEGTNYVVISDASKPILLRAGADKILLILGIKPTFEILEGVEDAKNNVVAFTVKCALVQGGSVIAEGLGHCNSREREFASQNKDLYAMADVILRTAKERALVDATLTIACLSEVFTQETPDAPEVQVVSASTVSNNEVRVSENETEKEMPLDKALKLKLNFGKYKDKTLQEIYKTDSNYVLWLSENAKNAYIRRAAQAVVSQKDESAVSKDALPF